MMKTKSDFVAQHAPVRPSAPPRPRVSAGHRAAHVEARPSWPTARDGGRPARDGKYARTPLIDSVFTANSTTLFT